jgi:hypothetical protein
MVIVGDNEVKLTNYAANRHILLDAPSLQPEYRFNIRYGMDVLVAQKLSQKFVMLLVLICTDKVVVTKIVQTPPELYCEFPNDSPGTKYQMLLQFNTSQCSAEAEDAEDESAEVERLCRVSMPILVETKQVQLEVKHTNSIQFIMVMAIICVLIIVLAFSAKHHNRLHRTFLVLKRKL